MKLSATARANLKTDLLTMATRTDKSLRAWTASEAHRVKAWNYAWQNDWLELTTDGFTTIAKVTPNGELVAYQADPIK